MRVGDCLGVFGGTGATAPLLSPSPRACPPGEHGSSVASQVLFHVRERDGFLVTGGMRSHR